MENSQLGAACIPAACSMRTASQQTRGSGASLNWTGNQSGGHNSDGFHFYARRHRNWILNLKNAKRGPVITTYLSIVSIILVNYMILTLNSC